MRRIRGSPGRKSRGRAVNLLRIRGVIPGVADPVRARRSFGTDPHGRGADPGLEEERRAVAGGRLVEELALASP
jgi:hypothetical protein